MEASAKQTSLASHQILSAVYMLKNRSSGMAKVKALAVWTDRKLTRGSDSDAVDCSREADGS